MKTFVVGGAVRDRLLGLPVIDRDHVVVGATVDEMLAAGFRPVGRDFPVFLHPATHEEYALARTERKVAPGYAGFVFHADPAITLEADLARRDLTINAIAEDEASGQLIDPFDGRGDLKRRLFRHVGPAFSEDPVRLLRTARFAARFTDFSVAPGTRELMRCMTQAGEIDALVAERVWHEVARGLMEVRPSRMFDVLCDTGALERVLPEIDALFGIGHGLPQGSEGKRTLRALDRAAGGQGVIDVRFAVLLHALGTNRATTDSVGDGSATDAAVHAPGIIERLCARLAVPRAARDLAIVVAREREPLLSARAVADPSISASTLVTAMERSDAFRRKPRFHQAIEAIGYTLDDERSSSRGWLEAVFEAAYSIDAGAVAREADYDPSIIASRLHAARSVAVAALPASNRAGGAGRAA